MVIRKWHLAVIVLSLFLFAWAYFSKSTFFFLALAFLRGEDLILSSSAPSPSRGSSDEKIQIGYQLKNLSSRQIGLLGRKMSCSCAHLARLPESIAPGETIQFDLIVEPRGLNGPLVVAAVISTDSSKTPELRVNADLFVEAVEVRRAHFFGIWRAGTDQVVRTVKLENLPSNDLVDVGPSSVAGWKISVSKADGRSLELQLVGNLPEVPAGKKEVEFELLFDLLFRDSDVQRAKVRITAILSNEEWKIPDFLSISLLSSGNAQGKVLILHRPRCEDSNKSSVVILSTSSDRIRARVTPLESDNTHGWKEERFELIVTLEGEFPRQKENAKEFIRLSLTGDHGDTLATIPIMVIGTRG